MRKSIEYRSGSREVYKSFCEANPTIQISFNDWLSVLKTFNRKFRDHLLETGEKVKLPWGLGQFAVSKKKPKKFVEVDGKTYVNLPVDWKKTREAGKKIYNFNAHTDGYRCKWYWFIKDARFYMSDIWYFKPSKESSLKITEYIRKIDKNYIDYWQEWSKGYGIY